VSGASISPFLALVGIDWCAVAIWRPLFSVNVIFFWNVTVGFWLIGCLQRSFWLIDPFWTLLPPLISVFYVTHPLADADAPSRTRQLLGLALVGLWSVRLTHSYFRREEWKFGQREDWRYSEMAAARPRAWWALSFVAVGFAQQPMLVGRRAWGERRGTSCDRESQLAA
jgi:steroid 5-alpha reductase family enzyme